MKNPECGRPTIDYIFKLDPAKEIAMVENNEKGKQIRKYFIQVEEKFKQQSLDTSQLSPQMQLLTSMVNSMAQQEIQIKQAQTIAIEAKTGLQQAKEVIENIKDTMAELPKDKWREWVTKSMNEIVRVKAFKHDDIRNVSYNLLEEKAGADLAARVRNERKRLEERGATKTAINTYCKLDAIEEDKRLKEIYSGIIKALRIKYLV